MKYKPSMMSNAGRLTSLCLLILLTGCATPDPIVKYEVREVVRDRYIALPENMTKPCETVELPEVVDTLALGAAYKQLSIRMRACNSRLDEIRSLGEQ